MPSARDIVTSGVNLTLNELLHRVKIDWHGVRCGEPDWDPNSHSLAFTVQSLGERFLLHGMFNAYWEPLALRTAADSRRRTAVAPLRRHCASLAGRHPPVAGRASR
jgi:hypothetical protein